MSLEFYVINSLCFIKIPYLAHKKLSDQTLIRKIIIFIYYLFFKVIIPSNNLEFIYLFLVTKEGICGRGHLVSLN